MESSLVLSCEDWVAEKGIYTINIGASSKNLKLSCKFSLAKELIVERDSKSLSPQVAIDELKK
ncbi:hypothetical protein [Mucilaginibacter sp.]|uniref:hypothetical protein n=1 Tax=Mucilaginibacter sp. TaxID=1882438 RepID=UPI003267CB51